MKLGSCIHLDECSSKLPSILSLDLFLWFTDIQNFCQVFSFRSFSQKVLGLEPWNLGRAYIWLSAAQSCHQYWALTYFFWFTDFVNICQVFGHFRSFSQKLKWLEQWNLGHAYIWMCATQSYHEHWAVTYILRLTDFVKFCQVFAFRSFSQKL